MIFLVENLLKGQISMLIYLFFAEQLFFHLIKGLQTPL